MTDDLGPFAWLAQSVGDRSIAAGQKHTMGFQPRSPEAVAGEPAYDRGAELRGAAVVPGVPSPGPTWQEKKDAEARIGAEAEAEREREYDARAAERSLTFAAREAAEADACGQDGDFHAYRFSIAVDASWDDWLYLDGKLDPSTWQTVLTDESARGERSEGNIAANSQRAHTLVTQIGEALTPWFRRFEAMGCIRADGVEDRLIGGSADRPGEPTFYLICDPSGATLGPAVLGVFGSSVLVESLPDARVRVTGSASPVNATTLYESLYDCRAATGAWGGNGTPDQMPGIKEGRDAWLERMAVPFNSLARLIEGWEKPVRTLS